MTRLENLRSMSAEELAEEMANFDLEYCRPEYCPHFHDDGTCDEMRKHGTKGCIPACLNYLNAEIEDK